MQGLEHVLIRPLMTEKMTKLTETQNIYGFRVSLLATKGQIKEAIERLYDVRVEKVWTSISAGKIKRSGKKTKKGQSVKKAIVHVREGQKIEFFKGL